MKRVLQSSWFVALMGCVVYLATTAALLRPDHFAGAQVVKTEVAFSPSTDPSWKFRNPEFEQWVRELKAERQALDTREQQLRELQSRLEAEHREILSITQTVHQLQAEFDRTVVRLREQELENLKHQSKVITGMSADGAALMLREMPDDQMVRTLYTLKPDRAGSILDALSKMGQTDAKRAAEAAERLRQVLLLETKTARSSAAN
ncbi:MAG TPA: hypothetical protein VN673_14110 [Clostridia bacterium]|nr:hypothetical protein [Clostridia bacterium]